MNVEQSPSSPQGSEETARSADSERRSAGRSLNYRAPWRTKKDDDDDDGPRPSAGAIVARLFPFFRPVGGFALA